MRRLNSGKRGQVWVETVIYTLIGLAIMGLVLAVALPKINQKKDEVSINQAMDALQKINSKVYEVQKAVGNRRIIDLSIGNGKVIIDMDEDTISWILESSFKYSEPGVAYSQGGINVTTTAADPWNVELKLGYAADIQYDEQTAGTKEIDLGDYELSIENVGKNANDNIVVTLKAS